MLIVALLLTFGCAVRPSVAQEKDVEIRGTIKKLDLETGTVTLRNHSNEKLRNFSLSGKDLPVTNVLAQPARLADLQLGYRVAVKVAEGDEIVAIRLEWPAVWGVLKKADLERGLLSLQSELRDYLLPLPKDVQILFDGKPAQWSALKEGQPIRVILALDRKTILQVGAGPKIPAKDPQRKLKRHDAMVLDIDRPRRQLHLLALNEYDPMTLERFPVAAEVPVKIMNHDRLIRKASFEQMDKLVKISYLLDTDTNTIEALEVQMPQIARRKLLRIDPEQKKLTYEDRQEEKTLPFVDDIQVRVPKGEGKLSDLVPGALVNLGLSMDRSQVIVVGVLPK